MRGRLVVALALCLLAAPAAQAQVQTYNFLVTSTEVADAILEPGNSTTVTVHLARACNTSAYVLEAQTGHVALQGNLSWIITGPLTFAFQQQPCATQPMLETALTYTATAPQDANAGSLERFVVRAQLEGTTLTPGSAEAMASFPLSTPPAPAMDPVAEPVAQEAPMLPSALLALALLGSASAMRRR
jgi:hypothetical protein